MALLYDMNIYAQQDKRTDSRAYTSSQANSYTYAPIYAYNSSVMGNTAKSNADAQTDAKFSEESGFTGKNAQTVLLGLGAAAIVAGAVYVFIKV